jgi:hypothetical protein
MTDDDVTLDVGRRILSTSILRGGEGGLVSALWNAMGGGDDDEHDDGA